LHRKGNHKLNENTTNKVRQNVSKQCCCCYVTSVISNSMWPYRRQPTRLCRPWESPGKNIGVGCYFLLQCMKVKSESEVAQSCPTLHNPMDCSLPGSSVHGIFQARVLEWVAVAFSGKWCYQQAVNFQNTQTIHIAWYQKNKQCHPKNEQRT